MVERGTHKPKAVGSIPTPATNRKKYMIKRIKNKFIVLSETTGRRFGTFALLRDAKKRLRQIEFFKYAKKAGLKLRNQK